jgi:DNA-binding GntR family transcriptional regulator
MQEAYEIRAALEEIAGRTAGDALKDNVTTLLNELAGMRSAARKHDVNAFVNHDIGFHRAILKASPNSFLIRLWDGLSLDLRMRALIGKIAEELHVIAESHQPIVDALQNGRSRQAGLLLRNHGIHKKIQIGFRNAQGHSKGFGPSSRCSTSAFPATGFIDSFALV